MFFKNEFLQKFSILLSLFISSLAVGIGSYRVTILFILIGLVLGYKSDILKICLERNKSRIAFWLFALIFIIYLCHLGYLLFIVFNDEKLRFQPFFEILLGVLDTLFICFCEEFVFRGLITNLLAFKYAHSKKGVFFVVLFSSLIFGAVHLGNLFLPNVNVRGVLFQCFGVAILTVFDVAFYLRSGSLVFLIIMHFMGNLIAEFDVLFLNIRSFESIVSYYGSEFNPILMLDLVFALVFAWLVLRGNGIDEIKARFKKID